MSIYTISISDYSYWSFSLIVTSKMTSDLIYLNQLLQVTIVVLTVLTVKSLVFKILSGLSSGILSKGNYRTFNILSLFLSTHVRTSRSKRLINISFLFFFEFEAEMIPEVCFPSRPETIAAESIFILKLIF